MGCTRSPLTEVAPTRPAGGGASTSTVVDAATVAEKEQFYAVTKRPVPVGETIHYELRLVMGDSADDSVVVEVFYEHWDECLQVVEGRCVEHKLTVLENRSSPQLYYPDLEDMEFLVAGSFPKLSITDLSTGEQPSPDVHELVHVAEYWKLAGELSDALPERLHRGQSLDPVATLIEQRALLGWVATSRAQVLVKEVRSTDEGVLATLTVRHVFSKPSASLTGEIDVRLDGGRVLRADLTAAEGRRIVTWHLGARDATTSPALE